MKLSTRVMLFVAIAMAPVLLDDLRDLLAGKMAVEPVPHRPAERRIASIQPR